MKTDREPGALLHKMVAWRESAQGIAPVPAMRCKERVDMVSVGSSEAVNAVELCPAPFRKCRVLPL